jgi:hypothetical protein
MGSNFRVTMNEGNGDFETLTEILPESNPQNGNRLRLLIVGKRPAPFSVEVGHYFQGQQGKSFWSQLDKYDILKVPIGEYQDDHLIDHGFGIIDIVKRPGEKGDEPTDAQYRSGMKRVLEAISIHKPEILLFVYKMPLKKMLETISRKDWRLHYGFNENIDPIFNNSKVFICPLPGVGGATKEDINSCMNALKNELGSTSLEFRHINTNSEDIYDLIRKGENTSLEFKATFRWSLQQQKTSDDLMNAVLKAIVGFSNSKKGGDLLIGVNDNGMVVGLDNDYRNSKPENKDGFQQLITQKVSSLVGVDVAHDMDVNFYLVDGKEMCKVHVIPGHSPVYLVEKGNPIFYLRMGNSTRPLGVKEANEYCLERFRKQ